MTEEPAGKLMPAAAAGSKDSVIEDDECEELTASTEARVPRSFASPEKLTQGEIDEHYFTHLPYRSWCPICAAAAG